MCAYSGAVQYVYVRRTCVHLQETEIAECLQACTACITHVAACLPPPHGSVCAPRTCSQHVTSQHMHPQPRLVLTQHPHMTGSHPRSQSRCGEHVSICVLTPLPTFCNKACAAERASLVQGAELLSCCWRHFAAGVYICVGVGVWTNHRVMAWLGYSLVLTCNDSKHASLACTCSPVP